MAQNRNELREFCSNFIKMLNNYTVESKMVKKFESYLQLQPLTLKLKNPFEEETDYLLLIILICCFIIVPTLLWFSVRQRKRCPQCHKHTLRQLSIRTISRMNGIRTEEIVLHCTNCGHIVRRQRQVRDEDDFHHRGGNGGPFLGGPFFGGGFGGSGGGGFSGGSFGGGSFGGGGAGSKF